MKRTLALALISLAAVACSSAPDASDRIRSESGALPTSKVVLKSEVKWEHLNPARGDKAPQAGTLWGDRNGHAATGFLLKPKDGFKSPPHIHNVSYRGVVIRGFLHNDDPNAQSMWMPAGSFWTQPKGGVHITSAKGSNTLAYIEIDEGPYLVLPTEQEFQTGEKPVNLHESNIVWLDASNTTWVSQPRTSAHAEVPKVAFLWGNPQDGQLSGSLIQLPAGFVGELRSRSSEFRAVVIEGNPLHGVAGQSPGKLLEAGSYFESTGESVHQIACEATADCVIYVRTRDKFDVIGAAPTK